MREGLGPGGVSSSGVNIDEAKPSFYLTESGGARLKNESFGGLWAADVGNPNTSNCGRPTSSSCWRTAHGTASSSTTLT